MLSLSKTFEFAASHRLFQPQWSETKNVEVYGKCANPNGHGHSYTLEVTVQGDTNPETGMIINAADLNAIVRRVVIDELDHKNLNLDVPWLQGMVTTVENIIDAIWRRLAPEIAHAAPQARLARLKLWETSRVFAELTDE